MNEQITLKMFLHIMRKRILTILITVLCTSLLIATLTIFVIKPSYEVTESIFIGKLVKEDSGYGDSQEVTMLLASTVDFIKSPVVLNSVQKELKIQNDELEKKIVVQNNKDSQIVNVIVRDKDRDTARKLAKAIAVTAVNKMKELFGVKDIQLLSDASGEPPIKKVGNPALNIAIGTAVGFFFGVALAMFREYWDDSIKEEKDIEELLGLLVLGEIQLKNKRSPSQNKKEAALETAQKLNSNKRRALGVYEKG